MVGVRARFMTSWTPSLVQEQRLALQFVLESSGGGAKGSPTELEVEEEGNLCDSLCTE